MTDDLPPMAPSAEERWRDLCEKDDRTSPEEYPDMALIKQDELVYLLETAFRDGALAERARRSRRRVGGPMNKKDL